MIGIPEGEEKEQGIETVWKNNHRKNSEPGEGKSHASSGSTENPKQDEPKEANKKIYHN